MIKTAFKQLGISILCYVLFGIFYIFLAQLMLLVCDFIIINFAPTNKEALFNLTMGTAIILFFAGLFKVEKLSYRLVKKYAPINWNE